LLHWHGETKTVHDQTDAQIEAIRQKGRNEVRSILTPEQRPKFEEFLKRFDEERKRLGPPPAR
jgi:Spy/CpxP family protein refolding chaperone